MPVVLKSPPGSSASLPGPETGSASLMILNLQGVGAGVHISLERARQDPRGGDAPHVWEHPMIARKSAAKLFSPHPEE